jgi:hypothetical protein
VAGQIHFLVSRLLQQGSELLIEVATLLIFLVCTFCIRLIQLSAVEAKLGQRCSTEDKLGDLVNSEAPGPENFAFRLHELRLWVDKVLIMAKRQTTMYHSRHMSTGSDPWSR